MQDFYPHIIKSLRGFKNQKRQQTMTIKGHFEVRNNDKNLIELCKSIEYSYKCKENYQLYLLRILLKSTTFLTNILSLCDVLLLSNMSDKWLGIKRIASECKSILDL